MRFPSKKNKVTLEGGIVIKQHADGDAMRREVRALEHLHQAGLAVPTLLAVEENALKLQYLAGPTYAELVETMTFKQAEAIADWLADYHRITGLLRGDCNLRNFLWSKETCVGVDFEDYATAGEWEIDMGKILAFAVTYNPPLTAKKADCAALLLQAFGESGGEFGRIKSAYLQEIAAMNQRRENALIHLPAAASFLEKLF
jgi:tRNA A-37 threonylcarbamoyl transferase component Bud32